MATICNNVTPIYIIYYTPLSKLLMLINPFGSVKTPFKCSQDYAGL